MVPSTMPDLLESHAPLQGADLAERMAALRKAVAWAAEHPDAPLSDTGRLHLDFWIHFRPENVSPHTFIYKTGDGDAPTFEVTLNGSGIFYSEISQAGTDSAQEEQLFSEFWFYGPECPMPDLAVRHRVVHLMKKAFADPDCLAARMHFDLFEYPKKSTEGLHWEEGNHMRTDFISISPIGIEMGYWTWRDPPGKPGFLSFERFLHLPPEALPWISFPIRARIEDYLGRTSRYKAPAPVNTAEQVLTPRGRMDAAEKLLQDESSEAGAEALIALLDYASESDYWPNYVFQRFNKLRGNVRVQHFILECLRGDHEVWFKKAVDVLTAWGFFYGDVLLADRILLRSLNWEDATANDPNFRIALKKASAIVLTKSGL